MCRIISRTETESAQSYSPVTAAFRMTFSGVHNIQTLNKCPLVPAYSLPSRIQPLLQRRQVYSYHRDCTCLFPSWYKRDGSHWYKTDGSPLVQGYFKWKDHCVSLSTSCAKVRADVSEKSKIGIAASNVCSELGKIA